MNDEDKKDIDKEGAKDFSSKSKAYKFAKEVEGCDEAIEEFMTEPNGTYYRLVHNPIIPNDDLPQPLQEWEGLTKERVSIEETLPDGSSLEEQWEQVQNYSPSYNISDEKLAMFFLNQLDRRRTDKQKQKLLKKKGNTIVAVKLTPEDGKIQREADEDTGHVVFQPYEDFNISDHLDESFEPKRLEDYRDEKEK